MLSVTWAFGPPMNMKVPPACHSEDRHEPRLTTVHENARSAVECGSLLPLSLRPACWPWKGIPCLWRARPRASSWDQSGSNCRTPKRLRRLTPVFSIKASPIFMTARNLRPIFFSQSRFLVASLRMTGTKPFCAAC